MAWCEHWAPHTAVCHLSGDKAFLHSPGSRPRPLTEGRVPGDPSALRTQPGALGSCEATRGGGDQAQHAVRTHPQRHSPVPAQLTSGDGHADLHTFTPRAAGSHSWPRVESSGGGQPRRELGAPGAAGTGRGPARRGAGRLPRLFTGLSRRTPAENTMQDARGLCGFGPHGPCPGQGAVCAPRVPSAGRRGRCSDPAAGRKSTEPCPDPQRQARTF